MAGIPEGGSPPPDQLEEMSVNSEGSAAPGGEEVEDSAQPEEKREHEFSPEFWGRCNDVMQWFEGRDLKSEEAALIKDLDEVERIITERKRRPGKVKSAAGRVMRDRSGRLEAIGLKDDSWESTIAHEFVHAFYEDDVVDTHTGKEIFGAVQLNYVLYGEYRRFRESIISGEDRFTAADQEREWRAQDDDYHGDYYMRPGETLSHLIETYYSYSQKQDTDRDSYTIDDSSGDITLDYYACGDSAGNVSRLLELFERTIQGKYNPGFRMGRLNEFCDHVEERARADSLGSKINVLANDMGGYISGLVYDLEIPFSELSDEQTEAMKDYITEWIRLKKLGADGERAREIEQAIVDENYLEWFGINGEDYSGEASVLELIAARLDVAIPDDLPEMISFEEWKARPELREHYWYITAWRLENRLDMYLKGTGASAFDQLSIDYQDYKEAVTKYKEFAGHSAVNEGEMEQFAISQEQRIDALWEQVSQKFSV